MVGRVCFKGLRVIACQRGSDHCALTSEAPSIPDRLEYHVSEIRAASYRRLLNVNHEEGASTVTDPVSNWSIKFTCFRLGAGYQVLQRTGYTC